MPKSTGLDAAERAELERLRRLERVVNHVCGDRCDRNRCYYA